MTIVRVELDQRAYDIRIGAGLLARPESFVQVAAPKAHALIVSNTSVAPLYMQRLQQALAPHFAQVLHCVLPDGEEHKDWRTLTQVFDALLEHRCDRKTTLFALGGGVIGDMAGFAAASYMRGVPFVQVPTTLLAQVDSSVGGKTAINHPLGKNMIGAFYQPRLVVADIDTLRTLPAAEVSAGLAEIIKHGAIADATFFDWLETHMDRLRVLDPEAVAHAVRRSCEIKAAVVAQDETETGLRAILNFGHTFGHALEGASGFALSHGVAVGVGMLAAIDFARRIGLADGSAERTGALQRHVRELLAGVPDLSRVLGAIDPEQALRRFQSDKKHQQGRYAVIVVNRDGFVERIQLPADSATAAHIRGTFGAVKELVA